MNKMNQSRICNTTKNTCSFPIYLWNKYHKLSLHNLGLFSDCCRVVIAIIAISLMHQNGLTMRDKGHHTAFSN